MKIQIEIGPVCPPLSEQLRGVKISKSLLERLQRDCDALNRVYTLGYISGGAWRSGADKLIKAVQRAVVAVTRLTKPE